MSEPNGKSDQFIVIKSWQTVLLMVTIVAGMLFSYAAVRDQTDQNTRDIHELKVESIDRREYIAGQQDIQRRLERIERKLDDK